MTHQQVQPLPTSDFRALEGRRVSLTLVDGSQFEQVTLVSSGRGAVRSLWIDADGIDIFIPRTHVTVNSSHV